MKNPSIDWTTPIKHTPMPIELNKVSRSYEVAFIKLIKSNVKDLDKNTFFIVDNAFYYFKPEPNLLYLGVDALCMLPEHDLKVLISMNKEAKSAMSVLHNYHCPLPLYSKVDCYNLLGSFCKMYASKSSSYIEDFMQEYTDDFIAHYREEVDIPIIKELTRGIPVTHNFDIPRTYSKQEVLDTVRVCANMFDNDFDKANEYALQYLEGMSNED